MSRRALPVAANKEDTLFKEGLQFYESKHYKKSLKNCDQILKKSSSSNLAETLSLKALNLFFLKELSESEIYVAKAIQKNDASPVVNHILGILRRAQLRYKEAAVFFKKALDNGSMNKQI
jgi:peptide alpha-N-acetyltransferase